MVNVADKALARFIGTRVKELRARQQLSLRELASRANVSAAMISEIERGKKTPTIAVLSALATGLAVPTSYLFEKDVPVTRLSVTRRDDHRTVQIAPGMYNVVLGHPLDGSNVHFVRLEITKKAPVAPPTAPHPPGSIERAHVVSGRVELTVEDETVELSSGDSCAFRADRPHLYRNIGQGAAKVYLVVEFPGAPG
jgi:transcriptional regulator with XRE-family HTH domain